MELVGTEVVRGGPASAASLILSPLESAPFINVTDAEKHVPAGMWSYLQRRWCGVAPHSLLV